MSKGINYTPQQTSTDPQGGSSGYTLANNSPRQSPTDVEAERARLFLMIKQFKTDMGNLGAGKPIIPEGQHSEVRHFHD